MMINEANFKEILSTTYRNERKAPDVKFVPKNEWEELDLDENAFDTTPLDK